MFFKCLKSKYLKLEVLVLFIKCPSASVSQWRHKVRWIVTLNGLIFKSCGMMSHACCILLNSYQISLGWNAVAKGHQQEIMCHILWHSFWHMYLAYLWHSFWHSIWYIFGDSLWLRSGGEHCDLELAVEVRRGAEEGGRKEEGRKEEGRRRRAGLHKL